MNNNFLGLQYRDELKDTLFFAGLDYEYTRIDGVKKVYVFQTERFCLTIAGKAISIDGVKMKSVREAKQFIVERVI
jgi:hypothetical protein